MIFLYIIREKSGKEFRCMFSIHQILFMNLLCVSMRALAHSGWRQLINSSFPMIVFLFPSAFSLVQLSSPQDKSILFPQSSANLQMVLVMLLSGAMFLSLKRRVIQHVVLFLHFLPCLFVCFHNMLESVFTLKPTGFPLSSELCFSFLQLFLLHLCVQLKYYKYCSYQV